MNEPQSPDEGPLSGEARPDLGILNIDKPQGPTSHDVVDRVRRLTGQRRVGHTGTLDPMASGVLLVCVGKATRLAEYLTDVPKRYRATIRFGITTDTWDAEGQVLEEHDSSEISLQTIQGVLPRFLGPIEQVPPMYSAIKHQGQPLYRLARKGVTVERRPRLVEIRSLRVVSWQPPELVLEIECSKGTYIRSLAQDLGQALGTGAHLSALVRVAVGHFCIENAVSLETLSGDKEGENWRQYLIPPSRALAHMRSIVVGQETIRRICFGQAVKLVSPAGSDLCCAYDSGHHLIAILRADTESGAWIPHKVLGTCEAERS